MGNIVQNFELDINQIDRDLSDNERKLQWLADNCNKQSKKYNDDLCENTGDYWKSQKLCCRDRAWREKEIQGEISRLTKKKAKFETLETGFVDIGQNALKSGLDYALGEANKERQKELDRNKIIAEGLVGNKGARERLELLLNYIREPKTLAWVGGALVATTIGIVGGYYALKLAYQQIKARLGQPELVDETSRKSLLGKLKAAFDEKIMKKKPVVLANPTDEVILSPEIAAIAKRLADDAQQTNRYGLSYQNLLLYGPPGTGKTAFAKALAYFSGMDYVILSGSRFAQFKNDKAITELFNIFRWIECNPRGTLVFIDEAEACLMDRKALDQNGVNFVNAFISKTGSSSTKFMFVFATNYKDELDPAVRSRIHQEIPFELPEADIRQKILQQKIDRYIAHDQRTYEKDGKMVTATLTISDAVTPEFIRHIAKQIEGFSGRDIDYAVAEMRLRAYRSGENVLTTEIVNQVIGEKMIKVAKDRKTNALQDLRAANAMVKQTLMQDKLVHGTRDTSLFDDQRQLVAAAA
jgi:ATPase family AAA domain-containing protein 3A/B